MSHSPAPTKSSPSKKGKNGRARAVRSRPAKRSLIRWNGKSLASSSSFPWLGVHFGPSIRIYMPTGTGAWNHDTLILSYRDLRSTHSAGRAACHE